MAGGLSLAHVAEDATALTGWKVERVSVTTAYAGSAILERGVALHVVYSSFHYPDVTFVEHATNAVLGPDGIDQNCDGVDGIAGDSRP